MIIIFEFVFAKKTRYNGVNKFEEEVMICNF